MIIRILITDSIQNKKQAIAYNSLFFFIGTVHAELIKKRTTAAGRFVLVNERK